MSTTINPLALANAITMALYPNLYGNPNLSSDQVMLLMGCRGIIDETLRKELGQRAGIPATLPTVYDEVMAERARQDAQWGGPAHDDDHGPLDWLRYIDKQHKHARLSDYRERMVKIAALAVAAIESYDRNAARASGDSQ